LANFGYQAKGLISGVSTRPYALREDGHATTQENCFLSTKYGLAKRPGLTYLQTHSGSSSAADFVRFSLYSNDQERLIVGSGATDWQVFGADGKKYPVCHFPSSTSASTTAAAKYVSNGATFTYKTASTTTMGDVTWIADSGVTPKMTDAVWEGYTDTGIMNPDGTEAYGAGTVSVGNDDAFTVTIDTVHWSSTQWRTTLVVTEDIDGTVKEYNVQQGHGSNSDHGRTWQSTRVYPVVDRVASAFSYKISGGTNGGASGAADASVPRALINDDGLRIVQATNFNIYNAETDNSTWETPGNVFISDGGNESGLSTIICRYVGAGKLSSVRSLTMSGNITHAGEVTSCFKVVDDLSQLPTNSFLDHTLKVSPEELGVGYYMRFVSDDSTIKDHAINHRNVADTGYHGSNGTNRLIQNTRAQFDKTSKLPRNGHWEEYCGTDVKQSLDSSTMPLLFVQRPDDTYALMEARGAFQVNTASASIAMATDDTVQITFDGGFSDQAYGANVAPIVKGDKIKFTSGTLATGLALDTEYFVQKDYTPVRVSARVWKVKLSTTKDGNVVDITSSVTGSVAVSLTTYEDFDWTKRVAGDDETNPVPSFVDGKITSLFNFQNRLAFVAEDTVCFSGTGDYFNVFRTTVRQLDESDPFEVSPNTDDGDVIKYAMAFDTDVILISNLAQFKLSGQEGFSPSKAVCTKSSALSSDLFSQPTVLNDTLYLSYSQEEASGMYAIRKSKSVADKYQHMDVSENIPGYLPRGPKRVVGSPKHSMLFILDDTDNKSLYVYSFADDSEGRVHSAWTKWTFGEIEIHDIIMMGDRLYCITDTTNMLCLQYIDLDLSTTDTLLDADDALLTNFSNVLIDSKAEYAASSTPLTNQTTGVSSLPSRRAIGGIYSIAFSTNTTIDLKYKIHADDIANVVIVLANDTGTIYEQAASGAAGTLNVSAAGGATLTGFGVNEGGSVGSQAMSRITVYGVDLRAVDFYIGIKYTMTSTYGAFLPSTKDGPVAGRSIFVRGGRITYSQANSFDLKVTHGATTYTQNVAASTNKDTRSGDTMFAIRKHLPDLAFTVENTKPWNAMFQVLKYDLVVQEIAGG
jgi:hypothetical protein